jgi:uncharacterized protein (UPF0332 family)
MTDTQAASDYLTKATESLAGAASELANRRFNNCANRCYYACFQAAIAALLAAGVVARSSSGRWSHEYVQAQFNGHLINRRKRYPGSLSRTLTENMALRHAADYGANMISEIQAHRALRRCREFVTIIESKEGGTS